ncbi:hypothetical protein ASF28_16285 [Methylobacterium sp. Leaf99]|uniref:DUF2336 domain-containing protein n=1 Tax=Methylobacterium sp. Leaf99 TaxID=1736251 RepID=UPI0006F47D75|nr:DUF2336 domain-containing protein [Methylobacterium sp. Leaf99]KQP06617.1 hypothetical protein ASF28_16285 [Methylobacterium sp. Leaf99]
MIIRQFLAWTQHASAERRAEAAGALVQAILHGGLAPDTAGQAEATILALLDDPAPMVRRALAVACATSPATPRSLVVALAGDLPDIACLVLRRSPVLTDADLVDGIAIGCEAARVAIAERRDLSHAVAGAMAEIAGPEALAAMVRNRSARITAGSLLRLVARHGDDASLREAVLARPHLPLEVRQACTDRLAEVLSRHAVASGWLTPARGERAGREARERATLEFSTGAHPIDLARFVAHLRTHGQLNAGLILRAILSGHMPFAETALADLAGLAPARVAGLMHEGSSAAYAALHRKAGLPAMLLPAFTAALSAWREAGRGESTARGAALSRLMIERALTACETMPFADAQGVMALLARFEAEAARDAARTVTRAMAAQPALAAPTTEAFPEAEAVAVAAEILDAEWREAKRQAPRDEAPRAVPRHAAALSQTLAETAAITGHRDILDLSATPEPSDTPDVPEAPQILETPEVLVTPVALETSEGVTASVQDAGATATAAPEAAPAAGIVDDGVAVEAQEAVQAQEAIQAGEAGRNDPVGLILEALPRAILAQFQEDRAAKLRETTPQDDAQTRTATVAEILDTIPNALVASYRADRERVRLAA